MPDSKRSQAEAQINVPPVRPKALWKVIVPGIRCPTCGDPRTKAQTGKRINAEGFSEHYRQCKACGIRFRVIFE